MTEHEQTSLHAKTEQYTHKAELGLNPEGLHESLLHDMKTMTASQYQKMLTGITSLNEKDREVNSKLPKLELFSSTGSPIPDSIRAKYDSTKENKPDAGEGKISDSNDKASKRPSDTGFSEALLQKLGLPETPDNMTFLNGWAKAEGSGDVTNPLDIVQPGAKGSGVQHFPSLADGVDATAKFLQSGRYNNILDALRDGSNARAAADAVAQGPWGTRDKIQLDNK